MASGHGPQALLIITAWIDCRFFVSFKTTMLEKRRCKEELLDMGERERESEREREREKQRNRERES